MQRKESARGNRGMPRTPVYPTYTPPSRPSGADSYDSYEAEKNKTFNKLVQSLSLLCLCDRARLTHNQAPRTKRKGHAAGQKVQNHGHV